MAMSAVAVLASMASIRDNIFGIVAIPYLGSYLRLLVDFSGERRLTRASKNVQ